CDERSDFHVGSWIDKLRKESEEEQRNLWVENVRQNTLTKCGERRATAKIGWQSQFAPSIQDHFHPKKNQIRAAEYFYCNKSECRCGQDHGKPQRSGAGMENTSE